MFLIKSCLITLLCLISALAAGEQTTSGKEFQHTCSVDFEKQIHQDILINHCVACHTPDGEAKHTHFILSNDPGLEGALFNEQVIFDYDKPVEIIRKSNGKNHEGGKLLEQKNLSFQYLALFIYSNFVIEE